MVQLPRFLRALHRFLGFKFGLIDKLLREKKSAICDLIPALEADIDPSLHGQDTIFEASPLNEI